MTREKGKIQYYSTYSYLNLKMFYKLDYRINIGNNMICSDIRHKYQE